LGRDGIRVNVIAPGVVMTKRQMRLWHTPETTAAVITQQCIQEPVREDDIANAVAFFASEASRLITKQCLFVNAGLR
jgi:NAD(P)-dependent dehydrogenase (short-subunit alcohol dehydrogenase family)